MNHLLKKIQSLQPGHSLVYYTSTIAPISNCGDPDIFEVRNYVYTLHINDFVELTQRLVERSRPVGTSHEISVFDYIVTKKKYPPNRDVVARRKDYNNGIRDGKRIFYVAKEMMI